MAQEPPWIDLMSSSTVRSQRKFSAVNRTLTVEVGNPHLVLR
jgi:hypothetical protein